MIEVKNLTKVYKTKGGVTVRALDDVSVVFPERGMVFLLGRSGSGKSTLLNVTGGLDKPDSGEIIVKGRSSKDFSSSDFDSYRNTFIGFIFQEYNILNEFTVEQNIALALQLQGKPNDKKAVNALLTQVDLDGLGKRKPNTLSGGQKQRVAIARALIKSPEIIMADEPTGALDSKTGKQVFDTLKKLSEDKLVIVVSHDREFAQVYGDRIIELKDGKIISDESKALAPNESVSDNVSAVGGTVTIKDSSNLSETDMKKIFALLKDKKGETIITTNPEEVPEVKRVLKIHDSGEKEYFSDTKEVEVNVYDGKKTKFIKSKLPASHAFKMGSSGLKVKPFRLLFTMLLSVVAFTMFGTLSTFMTYNPNYSIAVALETSAYTDVAITKQYKYKSQNYKVDSNGTKTLDYEYENDATTLFSTEELESLNTNTVGLKFVGAYSFGNSYNIGGDSKYKSYNEGSALTLAYKESVLTVTDENRHYYKATELSGFTDCGAEFMESAGFQLLAGAYPTEDTQIAVSEYIYNLFKNNSTGITGYSDFLNKDIKAGTFDAKVVGIYKSDIDPKYDQLKEPLTGEPSKDFSNLEDEFESVLKDSFNTLGFVTAGFINNNKTIERTIHSQYRRSFYLSPNTIASDYVMGDDYGDSFFYDSDVSANKSDFVFYDKTTGDVKEYTLSENQIYLGLQEYALNRLYSINDYIGSNAGMETTYADFLAAYHKYEENRNALTVEDVNLLVKTGITFNEAGFFALYTAPDKYYYMDKNGEIGELEVAGYYMLKQDIHDLWESSKIIKDSFIEAHSEGNESSNSYTVDNGRETYTMVYEISTDYVASGTLRYDKLISKTTNSQEQTYFVLENSPQGSTYEMTNSIYASAAYMSNMLVSLKTVFLIVGLVVGGFSALMLLNFIATSISAKRKEIGILRAVGARGTDVFKIFFSESFIIASLCFVFSAVATYFVCNLINSSAMESFISLKLLDYGILNVGLILVISFVVSFIATFIPVYFTAKKAPVESIRAL